MVKAKRKRAPSIEAARRAAFKQEVREREKLKKPPERLSRRTP